jgi:hypothetical protein
MQSMKHMGYVRSSVESNFLFYFLIIFKGREIKICIGFEVWKFVCNFDGEMYLVKSTWKTKALKEGHCILKLLVV